MKFIIIIIFISVPYIKGFAQFGPQQIISTEVFGTNSVISADIDGDNDMDVITEGHIVAWYENLNGFGDFGEQQMIANNAFGHAFCVATADFDGDGDLDVLSSFWADPPGEGKIIWNENLDGQGGFGNENVIDLGVPTATTVIPVDIDNDADFDVVLVDRNNDKIAWYENLNGLGDFGPQIIISIVLDWPIKGHVADIDNDGYVDIIGAAYDGNQLGWFRNLNGTGSFSKLNLISSNVINPRNIFAADIDMDGDLDVVSSSLGDNKVAWYENMDGNGTFSSQHLVSTEVTTPRTLFMEDVDNDGDYDIITNNGVEIIWFKNINGLGDFSNPIIISQETIYPTSVFMSDIDQDGDFDVLSSSQIDHKAAWYENLTILSNSDNENLTVAIYPNPFDGIINIKTNDKLKSIKIFNLFGELIFSESDVRSLQTERIQSGVYIVELFFYNGYSESFKIIKK
ncbi:MAG: hypothetical protein CMC74_09060 [Flavobacteriaceae bacterium]|nr:hypothetical protein [Flavobacteriaceae bacterium]|tara:strand:- start:73766 stop:75133 length:1368 start_codon:yes stop_codon:yes gene_type:complete